MATTTENSGTGQTLTVNFIDPLAKAEALIKAYEDYVAFLAKADQQTWSLAYSHGITCPPNLVTEGQSRRDEITRLKQAYEQSKVSH